MQNGKFGRKHRNEKIKYEAQFFLGKHNLEAFRSIHCQSNSAIKTIDDITYKQIKQVKLWEKTHPNYLEDDKLLMEWQTMIRNMTGGTDSHHGLEKEKSSIKRELGMSVEVKNELVDKKI